MKKNYFYTFILLLCVQLALGQVSFQANGNTGFGDAIGSGSISISESAGTITIDVTKGAGNFNDTMVIYFDTGAAGRTIIDGNVNDQGDPNRRAISSAGTDASDISFPPGFEATHAIAVNTGFGGLWQIPNTGNVGDNQLAFVAAVGNPMNATVSSFSLTLTYANLGITNTADGFDFVATYLNSANGFLSNEGYGGGFQSSGNYGNQPLTITTYYSYPDDQIFGEATTAADGLYSDNLTWTNGNPPASTDQITINHNLTADTSVVIDNALTINSGQSLTINPDQVLSLNGSINNIGTLAFASSTLGSAQLLNGPSASITQPVQVDRFIPALDNNRRAFRFVSSSVSTSGSIYNNWQNAGAATAGIGTHITGSTSGANGFDASPSGAASLFLYGLNPSNSTIEWYAIDNTDVNTLQAGGAYRLFIRGDRNYDLSSVPADPVNSNVNLRATGALNLSATVNSGALNANADGFSFVGNPYQATVDMAQVTKNNVNPNFVYVWDPNANTQGAYITAMVDAGTPDPNQYIQPGQSFFVSTVANGPASLDFEEADKLTTENAVGYFSTPSQRPNIDISLYKDFQGNAVRADRLRLFLDGNNAVTLADAIKLDNVDENIASLNNAKRLSIETKAMPIDSEIIHLDITGYRDSQYTFEIDINGLASNLTARLHDTYLNTVTPLSNNMNQVAFSVDANIAGSTASDRFYIEFTDQTLGENDIDRKLFSLYPNPASGTEFEVAMSIDATAQLYMYNAMGQMVRSGSLEETRSTVNIDGLPSGLYLVNIKSGNRTETATLIIK